VRYRVSVLLFLLLLLPPLSPPRVSLFVRSFTEGSRSLTHRTTTVTITTPAHRSTEPLPLYLRAGPVRAFSPHGEWRIHVHVKAKPDIRRISLFYFTRTIRGRLYTRVSKDSCSEDDCRSSRLSFRDCPFRARRGCKGATITSYVQSVK